MVTAEQGSISDMECGEGFDRATLSLLGRQQELLEALKQTGKPLIVVYIEGRPLEKNWDLFDPPSFDCLIGFIALLIPTSFDYSGT